MFGKRKERGIREAGYGRTLIAGAVMLCCGIGSVLAASQSRGRS